jgi:predicted N-acetyltransferase YhbS
LSAIAPTAIETLLDAAFGADRKARTAYRLREGMPQIEALSFAALDEAGALIGTIQCWPVALDALDRTLTRMVLVGPVAVSPDAQRGGIGKQLMTRMLAAADPKDYPCLMMIGDPEYYDRFFGFSAGLTQQWDLPGPFERHRLLARIADGVDVTACGKIIPDPAFARATTNA